MGKKKKILFRLLDWKGRSVNFPESVKTHLARYHVDALFYLETLKEIFNKPTVVIGGETYRDEIAVYELHGREYKYLRAVIHYGHFWKSIGPNYVATIYVTDQEKKGRILWPEIPIKK